MRRGVGLPASREATRPSDGEAAPDRVRGDARTVVALGGAVLFTPTALALSDRSFTVLGLPSALVYVLAVWLVGIVLTRSLARRRPDAR